MLRILVAYSRYFNQAPHQGMAQRLPASMQSSPGIVVEYPHREAEAPSSKKGKVIAFPQTERVMVSPKSGQVIAFLVLNGLHHDYRIVEQAIIWHENRRMKGAASTGRTSRDRA